MLAIAAPGMADGALALDNNFGLHPSFGFLHERYTAGELVVFHAVASPYRDRSHFDGQNVLENGLTKPLGSADGWLNRALAALPRDRKSTRLNSSHGYISYAVFCLKKKKKEANMPTPLPPPKSSPNT